MSYEPHFDGPGYEPAHDYERLANQQRRVYDLMADAHWRTLREIATLTAEPEASVSAQLRHLRKPRFGGHTVERRKLGDRSAGLYEYRLVVNADHRR